MSTIKLRENKKEIAFWVLFLFYFLLCFDFDQIFCEVVQDFAAVFGDQDQVFDSYADAAWDIDARFYGEAHAWFQDFFVGEGDIAKLVDFQSDVVSGTVVKY